jgi:enamine deaminase RidA (YjgF/YER057c/UK114 family)
MTERNLQMILPEGWPRPKGFSHGVLAQGRLLCIAGQVGWDRQGRIVDPGFPAQFAQALDNVLAVVRSAGGRPEQIASLTIFVTDKRLYLASQREVGVLWKERMGRHYPAMALVEVAGLVEDGALVEIQGMAVLP